MAEVKSTGPPVVALATAAGSKNVLARCKYPLSSNEGLIDNYIRLLVLCHSRGASQVARVWLVDIHYYPARRPKAWHRAGKLGPGGVYLSHLGCITFFMTVAPCSHLVRSDEYACLSGNDQPIRVKEQGRTTDAFVYWQALERQARWSQCRE
jgi:hypothetical protein